MSLPALLYRRACCIFVLVLTAQGCQRAEEIEAYTAPKDPPPPVVASQPSTSGATTTTVGSTEPVDRMLAAILPSGERAWFFKVVGPIAAIDREEKAISDFFANVRVAGDERPTWTLPDGWTEQPGNAMRAATIVIPNAGKPLELTVTTLGWRGSTEDILSNVNRWRNQMQLPAVGQQQLGESTRDQKVGEATMTVVDLRGRFQSGGMMAPFAGGGPPGGIAGGGNPPPSGANAELPAGHPPIDAARNAPPLNADAKTTDAGQLGVPKFDVPASWKALAVPPEGMRKAAFQIADGPQKAEVTLIDLSANAGPMIADPLANLNRWRGEVGLPAIQTDALDAHIEKLEVDGQQATYAAIIPDPAQPEQSQANLATLAAMVPSGDRIWFIKLKGDRDLVAAEQERFKSFLKSLRFGRDGGAPDGN